MSEGYKPTEPDDLMVCLSLMDEHWPGYQNAKGIIRDHAVRMRAELRRQSQELERAREALQDARDFVDDLVDLPLERMSVERIDGVWNLINSALNALAAITRLAPEKP